MRAARTTPPPRFYAGMLYVKAGATIKLKVGRGWRAPCTRIAETIPILLSFLDYWSPDHVEPRLKILRTGTV